MDIQLFNFLHNFVGWHWSLDWLFIFLGEYLPYLLVIAFVFLIFWTYRKWNERFYFIYLSLLTILVSNGLIVRIIRFFYFRPRPFKALGFEPLINHLDSAALPSGHATAFFALAILMLFINKKYFWYFLVGAVVISFARVVAGIHWPADILMGVAVGISVAVAVKRLLPNGQN